MENKTTGGCCKAVHSSKKQEVPKGSPELCCSVSTGCLQKCKWCNKF